MPTDLPNLLTLGRVAAIPVLMLLAGMRLAWADLAAAAVFALAAITDFLDGWLARRWGQMTDFGRMLDPIADKLLTGAALMMLIATGGVGRFGVYAAILIMLREILVSGLREYLAGRPVGLAVTPLARWKTAAQMTAIFFLLAGASGAALLGLDGEWIAGLGEALLWAATALTLLTGWTYLRVVFRHASRPSTPPR